LSIAREYEYDKLEGSSVNYENLLLGISFFLEIINWAYFGMASAMPCLSSFIFKKARPACKIHDYLDR
tara:strand:+ start:89 stop:292 length:204 start_codon:yes stop_codon:yes gene_type:complete